ncbi:hypothetical protein VPH35_076819 [Triticum aestivum]
MRVLVTSGVFAAGNDSEAEVEIFHLNPLSRILVDSVVANEHHSQTSFVLAVTSPFYTEATLGLAEWFRKDITGPVPSLLKDVHGASLFDESTTLLDQELDELMARAITKAHPHVKCTVLDLPKVIDKAPSDGIVNYVAGDLFHSVPKSQAVMLKSDEDCVKIMSQCRDAIPSHEEEGKVIIIDIVLGPSLGPVMFEAQLLIGMLMLVNTRGRQRTENDWHELFMKAGFDDYKIVKKLGARGVFEVYK